MSQEELESSWREYQAKILPEYLDWVNGDCVTEAYKKHCRLQHLDTEIKRMSNDLIELYYVKDEEKTEVGKLLTQSTIDRLNEKYQKLVKKYIQLSQVDYTKAIETRKEFDIEEIKQTPIQEVLGIPSNRTLICCPFHQEKTASFKIYNSNTYNCFGCNENGDVISLVMKLNNCNFQDACKFLT